MDLSKVKARLASLNTKNNKAQNLWKPTAGKPQQVRIVPYKHDPSNPFIELLFHYGINNKTYLSPATFGRPDPIVEFSEKLKSAGNKDDWKTGKKFEPKMRTYVPILVRGEEDEGVKFWGFGKQVYESLLGIIADDDYGDISDPVNGRDIVIEYTEGNGAESYPKTNIRVKPNVTPVTTDKKILEKLRDQRDILEMFPELSYNELATIFQAWLNPEKSESADEITVDTSDSEETTSEEVVGTATKSVTQEKSVIQEKSKSSTKLDTADLEKEFDNLFK